MKKNRGKAFLLGAVCLVSASFASLSNLDDAQTYFSPISSRLSGVKGTVSQPKLNVDAILTNTNAGSSSHTASNKVSLASYTALTGESSSFVFKQHTDTSGNVNGVQTTLTRVGAAGTNSMMVFASATVQVDGMSYVELSFDFSGVITQILNQGNMQASVEVFEFDENFDWNYASKNMQVEASTAQTNKTNIETTKVTLAASSTKQNIPTVTRKHYFGTDGTITEFKLNFGLLFNLTTTSGMGMGNANDTKSTAQFDIYYSNLSAVSKDVLAVIKYTDNVQNATPDYITTVDQLKDKLNATYNLSGYKSIEILDDVDLSQFDFTDSGVSQVSFNTTFQLYNGAVFSLKSFNFSNATFNVTIQGEGTLKVGSFNNAKGSSTFSGVNLNLNNATTLTSKSGLTLKNSTLDAKAGALTVSSDSFALDNATLNTTNLTLNSSKVETTNSTINTTGTSSAGITLMGGSTVNFGENTTLNHAGDQLVNVQKNTNVTVSSGSFKANKVLFNNDGSITFDVPSDKTLDLNNTPYTVHNATNTENSIIVDSLGKLKNGSFVVSSANVPVAGQDREIGRIRGKDYLSQISFIDMNTGNAEYSIIANQSSSTSGYTKLLASVHKHDYDTSEIYSLPTKTHYIEGEIFNPSGLSLILKCASDGMTKVVSEGFTFNSDPLVAGQNTIRVSYATGSRTLVQDITIVVDAKQVVNNNFSQKIGASVKTTNGEGIAADIKLDVGGQSFDATVIEKFAHLISGGSEIKSAFSYKLVSPSGSRLPDPNTTLYSFEIDNSYLGTDAKITDVIIGTGDGYSKIDFSVTGSKIYFSTTYSGTIYLGAQKAVVDGPTTNDQINNPTDPVDFFKGKTFIIAASAIGGLVVIAIIVAIVLLSKRQKRHG